MTAFAIGGGSGLFLVEDLCFHDSFLRVVLVSLLEGERRSRPPPGLRPPPLAAPPRCCRPSLLLWQLAGGVYEGVRNERPWSFFLIPFFLCDFV